MAGAGIPPLAAAAEFCVVLHRNDSLGSLRRWRLFAFLCIGSFGVALGFAAIGAWRVLPYSALEMAVLCLAFRWIEPASDWERASVCGGQVIVERQRAGVRMRREFNRYWARVEVEDGGFNRPPRLELRIRRARSNLRGGVAAGGADPRCTGPAPRAGDALAVIQEAPGSANTFGASMERKGAGARVAASAAAFTAALLPMLAQAAREYNLQPPVTPVAKEIFDLHTYIMAICAVIFVGVFSVMLYSMFAHRKSKGHQAAQFHENTVVELVWTVIPFLILLLMAIPATKTVLAMKDTSVPDLTVKITGSQWKWNYDYLDDGFDYYSNLKTPPEQMEDLAPKGEHYLLEVDQPLVVPVGKKIRLLITSSDVIHAWFLPAAGVQQDAVPGFVRDDWMRFDQTGTFRGQCAKICGKEHGFMPIVVEVKSVDEYARWAAEHKKAAAAAGDDPNKTWGLQDLMPRGEKVFAANCAACHQANGRGVPGAFPALDGSKVVTGPKNGQIETVLNGVFKNGQPTAMVAWKGTLSDTDIAAVITYTRNSWGNHTGEAIQPAEVKAERS